MSRHPRRDLGRQLRDCLAESTGLRERQRVVAKIQKIAPTAPVPEP